MQQEEESWRALDEVREVREWGKDTASCSALWKRRLAGEEVLLKWALKAGHERRQDPKNLMRKETLVTPRSLTALSYGFAMIDLCKSRKHSQDVVEPHPAARGW